MSYIYSSHNFNCIIFNVGGDSDILKTPESWGKNRLRWQHANLTVFLLAMDRNFPGSAVPVGQQTTYDKNVTDRKSDKIATT